MSNETDLKDIWDVIVGKLRDDARITNQLMGFVQLIDPQGVLQDTLYVQVPTDIAKGVIEARVKPVLLEIMATLEQPAPSNLGIVVNPDLPSNIEMPAVEFDLSTLPANSATISVRQNDAPQARLNPRYTFESFVQGNSNRFAFAAAFAVAEVPAKAYNPLFIYGDSGLGKTHLLHAIGNYVQQYWPAKRVRYVSSEEFTNDFINSIQASKGAQFQSNYRQVDVLMIDDIQFLSGKRETQEAFFGTFNALQEQGKQVVITSDVVPRLLVGFEDRMISRFGAGLTTDIQAPELETRIAILRKKAEIEKIRVSDEILDYMAARVSSNIRELEGVLIRVTAYANLNRNPIDMALVQTVLKDVVPLGEENVAMAPIDIINAVSKHFGFTPDDMFGSSRIAAIAQARQIAMYLCREQTSLSLPKIGTLFGGRDHTTVMYAVNKVSAEMQQRRQLYNHVADILNKLKSGQRR